MTPPPLFTIGYEGAALPDLIATLRGAGVTLLVDTRERAQSRRRGFSKTALGLALRAGGIEYRHLRSLGTPPSLRKDYKMTHDFAVLSFGYRFHLATQGEALEALGGWAQAGQVCLLCYEAEPGECHRSLIAARLQELALVGEVLNLQVEHHQDAAAIFDALPFPTS
ncbi:DUF488 domain-containing protein [Deinococcus sp.]|uniref:DUF488 domain-containing protein n=1 Tax=Deinococcus sp. TaxID=47478 RepID=UPI0025DD2996|nr:DUF488 domain-containing protein [Deinococcus sp.]